MVPLPDDEGSSHERQPLLTITKTTNIDREAQIRLKSAKFSHHLGLEQAPQESKTRLLRDPAQAAPESVALAPRAIGCSCYAPFIVVLRLVIAADHSW